MQKYKEVVEILAIERICKHSARDERLPAKVDLDVRKNAKTQFEGQIHLRLVQGVQCGGRTWVEGTGGY
jgi:hypothetical protein